MSEPAEVRINRRPLYVFAAVFAALIALGVLSILYSNHVQQQSNRNWCSVVETMDDAYRAAPPTTATGVKLAVEIHQLRARLSCP